MFAPRFPAGRRRRSLKKISKRTAASRKRSGGSRSSKIERALRAIDDVVRAAKGKWYLFGAQAAILYGVPRTTKDIDLTLQALETMAVRIQEILVEGNAVVVHDRLLSVRVARCRAADREARGLPQASMSASR